MNSFPTRREWERSEGTPSDSLAESSPVMARELSHMVTMELSIYGSDQKRYGHAYNYMTCVWGGMCGMYQGIPSPLFAFMCCSCHLQDSCFWQPQVAPGGHFGPVMDLSWDPQGKYVVSVSSDQTVRLHASWIRDGVKQVCCMHIAVSFTRTNQSVTNQLSFTGHMA